jgi:tetratricopeptide (TPR) repeat protein
MNDLEISKSPEELKIGALALQSLGQFNEAKALFEEWASALPKEMAPYEGLEKFAHLADVARFKGDYEEALKIFDEGLRACEATGKKLGIDYLKLHGDEIRETMTSPESEAFWFSYAKIMNAGALAHRMHFEATGDKRHNNFAIMWNTGSQGITREFKDDRNKFTDKVVTDLAEDKAASGLKHQLLYENLKLFEFGEFRNLGPDRIYRSLMAKARFDQAIGNLFLEGEMEDIECYRKMIDSIIGTLNEANLAAQKSGRLALQNMANFLIEMVGVMLDGCKKGGMHELQGVFERLQYLRSSNVERFTALSIPDVYHRKHHLQSIQKYLEENGRGDEMPQFIREII